MPLGPTFGHTEPVQVHFDDLDVMGLLHNSRYALLVERAMSGFWLSKGWTPDPATSAFPDVFLVVKEYAVTFNVPIAGATTPLVDIWIDRIGGPASPTVFRFCPPTAPSFMPRGGGSTSTSTRARCGRCRSATRREPSRPSWSGSPEARLVYRI